MNINKKLKRIIKYVCMLTAVIVFSIIAIDLYVVKYGKKYIIEEGNFNSNTDCIIVLGARVWDSGKPSAMLEDRIAKSIELYYSGISDKIIMSGDHGRTDYDEVNVMKEYAVDKGVNSEDIFMDHAGFSTYETMYRAKEIFGVKKAVIVTKRYHLYRAVFVARKLGIEAYGIPCDEVEYVGQTYRNIREAAARIKDFLYTVFKPLPTYLGESIPVNGNGNITNDK